MSYESWKYTNDNFPSDDEAKRYLWNQWANTELALRQAQAELEKALKRGESHDQAEQDAEDG